MNTLSCYFANIFGESLDAGFSETAHSMSYSIRNIHIPESQSFQKSHLWWTTNNTRKPTYLSIDSPMKFISIFASEWSTSTTHKKTYWLSTSARHATTPKPRRKLTSNITNYTKKLSKAGILSRNGLSMWILGRSIIWRIKLGCCWIVRIKNCGWVSKARRLVYGHSIIRPSRIICWITLQYIWP